jgi:N-acetylglucosaminyl-diphospho-decaprenol L-rhamnosyltransferase
LEGLLLAVAAVIITYNSAEAILSCLEALARMAPEAKAIVVDNGSADGTVERVREWAATHPGVELIANRDNQGFAAAANRGVGKARDAEYILLLNPDAHLRTGLACLVAASQQYGLAAGKLVDQQGRTQAGFTVRRLPTASALIFELLGVNRLWQGNPVNRRYRELDRDLEQPGHAEQPAGAFLMAHRDVWEKLGGLDERFHPVWFEDVDFCRRALDAGYKVQYEPAAIAAHEGGHSVGRLPSGHRAWYWYVSLLKYAEKHMEPRTFRGICAAAVLGSVPRMAVGMAAERSLVPLVTYLRIMRFAGACLLKGTTGDFLGKSA